MPPRMNPGHWFLVAIAVVAIVRVLFDAVTQPLSLWEDADDE